MKTVRAVLACLVVLLTVMTTAVCRAQSIPTPKLRFKMLDGWSRDTSAESAMNSWRVFVPAGKTVHTSPVAIVIAFDKKDSNDKTLDNLKDYWAYDMQQTLSQEKAQFTRWQPSTLDVTQLPYMSIEITDAAKHASPQHLLVAEAPDGFYSVTLTGASVDILNNTLFNDFFNSLTLKP